MPLTNAQHSATLPCGEGFMKGSYHWHEPGVFLEDFLAYSNQKGKGILSPERSRNGNEGDYV